MKSFVISLSSASDRRTHISNEFAKQDIKFDFFDAVTPVTIDGTAQFLGLNIAEADLHPKEIACLLSHVALWQKAVDEKIDYIAIFEDDIYLGEQAKTFLMDASWIPADCQLIKLEMFYRKIVVELNQPVIKLADHRWLFSLIAAHMGCGGYILSYEMAQKLLKFTAQYKNLISVDHIVFKDYPVATGDKVYQIFPALCIQDNILTKGRTKFPSHLEDVRNLRNGEDKTKKKLSFLNKLKRESNRLFGQLAQFVLDNMQLLKGKRVIKTKFR